MSELSNSSRRLDKATYAPIQLGKAVASTLNRPFEKAATLNQMRLQKGEVVAVQNTMGSKASALPPSSWDAIQQFEPQPLGVLMPGANVTASLPTSDLQTFAKALVSYRVASLNSAQQAPPPAPSAPSTQTPPPPSAPPVGPNALPPRSIAQAGVPAANASKVGAMTSITAQVAGVSAAKVAPPAAPQIHPETVQIAMGIISPSVRYAGNYALVTAAKNADQYFDQTVKITPIGRLHLERLEMTPAGIERGELLATIPLAPQETTGVMQKEWATTSDEFSSIVTDYLEQVSEKGVTEKSELAQSSDVQTKHDNSLNLSASVSGSYGGFVSFSTNANMSLKNSVSDSEKVSRNHAVETTRKASTRSRKERKVTIQQVSTTGSEQVTTRTLTNPSTTNALRIDYYSMMRKWRVRLYRYGLRMTYDLAIPEPGAALRESLAALEILNNQISQVFTFNLDPNLITSSNWENLSAQYGIALDPPPDDTKLLSFSVALQDSSANAVVQSIDMSVPDGYDVDHVIVGGWASPHCDGDVVSFAFATTELIQMFTPGQVTVSNGNQVNVNHRAQVLFSQAGTGATQVEIDSLKGATGQVSIHFLQGYASAGSIYAYLSVDVLPEAVAAWQQKCWQTIQQAQSNAFYLAQQALVARRDALQAQIANVDTLTLRQEEMQEVMRGVLKWLLGPSFDFMPQEVQDMFSTLSPDQLKLYGPFTSDQLATYGSIIGGGLSFTGNELTVNGKTMDSQPWTAMYRYQEMVKFLQEAIEWESLLYLLYPYFWDVPSAWDFVRTLEHPDLTRQQFVRAGSARVVLTVRPGFEDSFASFVELGQLGQELGSSCSSQAGPSTSPVTLIVDQSDGFQVGMTVTIDTYESSFQEAEKLTSIPGA